MKEQGERKHFASKIGIILATAGSAVGLGNIWRFPVEIGSNGGAAYMLVYLLSVLMLGLPLMTAEFMVGRRAHSNTGTAFKHVTKNRFWGRVGMMGVFTGWFIMCYYAVVSGWVLDYLVEALTGKFNRIGAGGNAKVYTENFENFVANPWMPVVYMAAFVLLSHYIITRGVQKGIERCARLLMPLLFIILVLLAVCSLTTEGAGKGLKFLFRLDFSGFTYRSVLSAVGQSFYSLSIGMGCICTFASYFSRDTHLVGTAVKVVSLDTLVALLASVMIFPVVFTAGIDPAAGPSLVFIALPNVFQQAFGEWPVVCYVISVAFYFFLVIATLTSLISLHEVPTAYLSEELNISRRAAATIVTVVCIVIGSLCSLSMGVLSDFKVLGRNLFDFFDFTSGQIFLPISGLLIALFVGHIMKRDEFFDEVSNQGTLGSSTAKLLMFSLRYFVPVLIILIFLSGIGVFDWF